MGKWSWKVSLLALLICNVSLAGAGESGVLYVDDSAGGANDGSSWADAFADLQDALDAATNGTEIRVAAGVYIPAGPGADRTATFQLQSGVTILGGFAGHGQVNPDVRDIELYETTLSGDLNGDDGIARDEPSSDCCSTHGLAGCDEGSV